MPELPEVETVCRGLAPVLEGRRIDRLTLRRKDLRIPFPKDLKARAEGRKVERIFRKAKYIVMALDSGDALIAHLGMSGRMQVMKAGAPLELHDHVIFATGEGVEVRFNDPRRFGLLTVTRLADLDTHKLFKHLGPDPLDAEFTPDALAAALKGRKTSIKVALLDQRIVVGVGNIYASESLHLAGISPKRFLQFLTKERALAELREGSTVMQAAHSAGLSGSGRLHDLLITWESMTPGEARLGGEGLTLRWGWALTPVGWGLAA